METAKGEIFNHVFKYIKHFYFPNELQDILLLQQHVVSFYSTHNGAQWCYVRTPVQTYLGNHGHSTCSDLQRSSRYENMVWSYQACVTPYLTSEVCSYLLQNHRETNDDGNYM